MSRLLLLFPFALFAVAPAWASDPADAAGGAPPPPLESVPPPIEAPSDDAERPAKKPLVADENPTLEAPKPRRTPATPKADAHGFFEDPRVVAAGATAIGVATAAPCMMCCALCACPLPTLCAFPLLPALGAGAFAGQALVTDTNIDFPALLAATGVALLGGVVIVGTDFAIRVGTTYLVTDPNLLLPLLGGRVALAGALTLATAAAAGAAVYFLLPDEEAVPAAPQNGDRPKPKRRTASLTTPSAGFVARY